MPVYPSLYRAKATRWTGIALQTLVPQVFGEAAVNVTDFLNTPVLGMGWVMFQGGNPEFPVWLGPLTSTTGAAPIGEDEVWVGPGTPPGPQELWYDTDEPDPPTTARRGILVGVTDANGFITLTISATALATKPVVTATTEYTDAVPRILSIYNFDAAGWRWVTFRLVKIDGSGLISTACIIHWSWSL